MVDITSLKARLARLRLGSELDDDPRLEDPSKADLDRKRGKKKQKKAAQDPYNEYTKNTGGKRKKKNKLTRSDQKRGKKSKYDITGKEKDMVAGVDYYKDMETLLGTKKPKKQNKLTRSDQKRGKKATKKKKAALNKCFGGLKILSGRECSHEWGCEGVGQPITCAKCGKPITAQQYYDKFGDVIGWAKDGDLVKRKPEEIEEDRYRKKGNFVTDTYVDDKGDMYAPKDQV